jgi:AraC-like DNA-binding protein
MARTVVTVSNALIGAVLDGIALSETESRALLDEVGLSFDTVRDIHGRTSIVRLARLWRRVMRRTEDDFIGLRIGTSVRPDRFGLAVHAAQHGTDFRTVLVQFAKYATLVNDLIECKLDDARPLARFTARLHWNVLKLERHAVDLTFAATITWAHQNLDAAPGLREVRLKHGLTGSRARYERIFAAPIVFSASHNELVFDAAYLDAPVRARNPELGCILERFASQEIERIPAVTGLPAQLVQILRRQLAAGAAIELPAVAAELELTPRSLQRRLHQHATSFSVLLDDARRSLAPALLATADGNVEQVGFRLGYSEPTAFIRAFKKWYGMTPGSFRRTKSIG